jgi:hypothetical protein
MKLRVPGNFTGHYGVTEFKDGVSVKTVGPHEVNLLRAVMGGVEILEDDGETVDVELSKLSLIVPLEYFIDNGLTPPSKYLTQLNGGYPVPREPDAEPGTPLIVKQVEAHGIYSRADLEKVADTKGIHGLRELGTVFNVKSNSIPGLITAILGAQAVGENLETPEAPALVAVAEVSANPEA